MSFDRAVASLVVALSFIGILGATSAVSAGNLAESDLGVHGLADSTGQVGADDIIWG